MILVALLASPNPARAADVQAEISATGLAGMGIQTVEHIESGELRRAIYYTFQTPDAVLFRALICEQSNVEDFILVGECDAFSESIDRTSLVSGSDGFWELHLAGSIASLGEVSIHWTLDGSNVGGVTCANNSAVLNISGIRSGNALPLSGDHLGSWVLTDFSGTSGCMGYGIAVLDAPVLSISISLG